MILPASTLRSTPFRINPAPYPAVTPESLRMTDFPRSCVSGRSPGLSTIAGISSTSAAEVCVNDNRVDLHFGRWAHGNGRPAIEHDHGIAESHDELHVVLDDQEGYSLLMPG